MWFKWFFLRDVFTIVMPSIVLIIISLIIGRFLDSWLQTIGDEVWKESISHSINLILLDMLFESFQPKSHEQRTKSD